MEILTERDDLLAHFGTDAANFLGGGGEAEVFALPNDKVLRLMHAGADLDAESRRRALLNRLGAKSDAVPFAIPYVVDHGTYAGRLFTIEKRIPGISMDKALATGPARRDDLIVAYLDAAAAVARLGSPRQYGTLCGTDPITGATQTIALGGIAARSVAVAGLQVDAHSLARALPQPDRPSIVQLDYFPGNVMCDGDKITGVIDFGYATIAADARLTPIVAGTCLHSRIAANANDQDRATANSWLDDHGLSRFVAPTNRWLAAFWAFAFDDDPSLALWARPQLGL